MHSDAPGAIVQLSHLPHAAQGVSVFARTAEDDFSPRTKQVAVFL